MKMLSLALAALIVALQYPLWLGKGGWMRVWDLDHKVSAQRSQNATLQARNDALEVDVIDLKSGYEAIEERARGELGMVKRNEVFFQFVEGAVPTRH